MRLREVVLVSAVWFSLIPAAGFAQQHNKLSMQKKKQKGNFAEHIDFQDMVKRYLTKELRPTEKLEGIYSVSAIVTRRGGFLSNPNKEKVVARKDNYATVVIIKGMGHEDREYLSVSLDSKIPGRYPVVGEFTTMTNGATFVYRHYEPESPGISFTFALSESDVLDGVFVKMVKRKTITYKLSYLKIYPQREDAISNNQ